ncbi:MAG: sulfatase, partial [Candidatus Sumerlaeota bacterium]|nr:sulfatase [Candidatus Sumerlaeota bacterium]
MNRRDFMKRMAMAGPALACGKGAAAATSGARRPNLLYVFADQLRADALGWAGDAKAITPHFDRFAAQSVNFTHAVSVSPVCAAHRASLLTGKYPSSTGMVINELMMNPNHRSLARVLREAGYRVGYIGKWHLADAASRSIPRGPARLGFDGDWAAYNFNHQSYKGYYWKDGNGTDVRVAIPGHEPTFMTDRAIDFIAQSAAQPAPFALVLSWNPPHDPWSRRNIPAASYELFKDAGFPVPKNFREEPDPYMDRYPDLAFQTIHGKRQWKPDFLNGGLQECLRCYYAMVHDLDAQFGRLMKALDDQGLADDTIVVFSSDHGEMFGSQGRMYKLIFYEEAARVPLLIRWPGRIAAGRVCDACINTPDIMPTLLGLAGLPTPTEVEGMDLSHLCLGRPGAEP